MTISSKEPFNDKKNTTPSGSDGVLTLTIRDKAVLYATYMPFVKQGGIFIPTSKMYKLGDELQIVLHLMEETERFSFTGKVIWITPGGAQGNRATGIGVQLMGDEGTTVRNKIETYLAGALKAERPTHTM